MNINTPIATMSSDMELVSLLNRALNHIYAFPTYEARNAVLRGHLRFFMSGDNPRYLIDREPDPIEGTEGPEIEAAYEVPSFKMRQLQPREITYAIECLKEWCQSSCENWTMKSTRVEMVIRMKNRTGLKKASEVNNLSPEMRAIFMDLVDYAADTMEMSRIIR